MKKNKIIKAAAITLGVIAFLGAAGSFAFGGFIADKILHQNAGKDTHDNSIKQLELWGYDTETFTLVYTEYCEDYAAFYANALQDAEKAKKTREYGLDMENHPNWFDASCIPWLSYDSLHVELPDGYLFFAPIVNWGKYRRENGRLLMPVTVRLNHAIADGYLVANVYRLLQQEIQSFVQQEA